MAPTFAAMERKSIKSEFPVDTGPVIVLVTSVLLTLTTVAVILRCYTRIFLQKKFTVDDYLIVFSQACFATLSALTYVGVEFGAGKHALYIVLNHPERLHKISMYWWLSVQMFLLAVASVKISVVFFFCSLNPPRTLKVVAVCSGCLTVVCFIMSVCFLTFQCRPVPYFWTRFAFNGSQGSCLDKYIIYDAYQVVNALDILTDVVLAVLPCIMVWNMTMRRVEKFYLSTLLGLGALPAIIAITRAFGYRVTAGSSDSTYTSFFVGITSLAEPASGIIVVCIARLRPLFKKIIPQSWFSNSEGSSENVPLTIGRIGGRMRGIPNMSISETSAIEHPGSKNGDKPFGNET